MQERNPHGFEHKFHAMGANDHEESNKVKIQ